MEYKNAYLTAVVKEMEIRSKDWQKEVFKTIYFGGGTPSQLQQTELQQLFDGIYKYFKIAAHPEITLEANPDDLCDSYVSSLKSLPVNRISIGIQSFNDQELRLLNRRHTSQEAIEAVTR
jgi:oxygen-independent coproporphyrinogen-3 oxidase